ncbi:unnamed protein product [Pieris macdunnoughi]|uniref:Uncharacterized protein n=1 Tax=Pieris macdunnoughi TaxID=345717 RepID=A0A821PE29_9NEOP|nr:unnamed protein product [Pieris macdunnoughi]
MSQKDSDSSNVILCERFNKHLRVSQRMKGDKVVHRPNIVKKVVLSKQINPASKYSKSFSTGVISNTKTNVKTFKSTKSDCMFTVSQAKFDYCKNCGDCKGLADRVEKSDDLCNKTVNSKKTKREGQTSVQQHYLNKNFHQSTESITNCIPKKVSLDTIKEQPESNNSSDDIFRIYDDCSTEEIGFFNTDDQDNINILKNFRNTNFFECHSAKSRIHSITNKEKHKCIYRFYLNERLFPVPFNTDFNENIRCMECNLPLKDEKDLTTNGMIQAKVKLNNEVQDMILMLPVKKHLIIKERKMIKCKQDIDSVYFGIIKLDLNGDSMFNRTLPGDSLALKYQKGYRQYADAPNYDYTNTNNDDVIII